MNFKATKFNAAFWDSYLDPGFLPENQPASPYVWATLRMLDLGMRIAKSKALPYTSLKPGRGQAPLRKPTQLTQELEEFLAQYRPYINQLKDVLAGHTAHPVIKSLWGHLQRNNFLVELPAHYPFRARDVHCLYESVRTDAKSMAFQQEVDEWKEKYRAVTKDVRQVLQQRAKTHPQRRICRLVLGWSNQTGMPTQAYPVHGGLALAPLPQAEPLSLKLIHGQIHSLMGVLEHTIAPHCFLDAIWHHVRIPFSGYRTYLTLILDAADPMPDTEAILNGLAQFWQQEMATWGGFLSVVNAPLPWTFDQSGSGFFIPFHHYCGMGLVHADDVAKRSELYTKLVHFTCASQQVISLLPEADAPVIGTYSRNLGLQFVPGDIALVEGDAEKPAVDTDETQD